MVTQGGWPRLLQLAFQSIGIIYGDVGTSPLYAISSTFPDGIKDQDDLLGVLSLILYTLILIPMVKYVFIVLYADDNGDGKLIRQEISTCQPAVVTICLLFIRYFTFNSNILLF
jgi:K+ transporter